jgi:hypothetical protein
VKLAVLCKHVLIIPDEARGIALVISGTSTIPSGAFFNPFHRERGLWNCITLDARDSPNLRGTSFERLIQMNPKECAAVCSSVGNAVTFRSPHGLSGRIAQWPSNIAPLCT